MDTRSIESEQSVINFDVSGMQFDDEKKRGE